MSAVFNAVKTLFVGGRPGASLGRVLLLTTYVICMWKWTRSPDYAEYLFKTLLVFVIYIFGGKVNTTLGSFRLKSKAVPGKAQERADSPVDKPQ
jgi:hypothetical protein